MKPETESLVHSARRSAKRGREGVVCVLRDGPRLRQDELCLLDDLLTICPTRQWPVIFADAQSVAVGLEGSIGDGTILRCFGLKINATCHSGVNLVAVQEVIHHRDSFRQDPLASSCCAG